MVRKKSRKGGTGFVIGFVVGAGMGYMLALFSYAFVPAVSQYSWDTIKIIGPLIGGVIGGLIGSSAGGK